MPYPCNDSTDSVFHAEMTTTYWTLTLACTDQGCSWECGKAWRLHLFRFHQLETGVLDEGDQVLYATPPSVKARSPTLAFLLALEIGYNQSPPWLEYPGDFCESLTFEARRQMMHHQGREYHIE